MKNKTVKILMILIFAALMLLIGSHKSHAAHAYISASSKNVSVGDSTTVRIYGQAKAWSLKASGTGFSGATVAGGNLDSEGEGSFDKTYSFDTSKAGTYTLSLTGDVTDASGNTKDVSDTVTIVVSEKSNNNSNNNNNSSNNQNTNNNNNNQKEPTFKSANDTVYSTGNINVRKSYSTDSAIAGTLSEGEEIKREGIGDNGWSKVVYKGATAYIKTNLLTTEKPEKKSTDKSLKSLDLGQEGLNPAFNPETTAYTIEVTGNIEKLKDLKAIANDEKAKVEITGNENFKNGENTVKITVTAEDGTARIYTITVNKKEGSKNGLSSLKVGDLKLNPAFSSSVYEYKVNITDSKITKLDISAIANSEDADIQVSGNENLKNGQNTITITVTSEENQEKTIYKIIVNKEDGKAAAGITSSKNKKSKTPLIIGIGAIVVLIIAIIAVIIKNKRDNEYYDEEDEEEFAENMYGYSSRRSSNVERASKESSIGKFDASNEVELTNQNKNEDEEFNYNPYNSKDVYGDYKEPVDDPNKDLFGTINGVDESYNYASTKDDLSEAINNYKTQEQENKFDDASATSDLYNNFETPSANSSKLDDLYGSSNYNYGDDDYGSRRSRGKHSK